MADITDLLGKELVKQIFSDDDDDDNSDEKPITEDDLDQMKSALSSIDGLLEERPNNIVGENTVAEKFFGAQQALPMWIRPYKRDFNNAQAFLGNLESKEFMNVYEKLKGGGHISDAEGKKATNLRTSLFARQVDRKTGEQTGMFAIQDEKALEQLKELQSIYRRGYARALMGIQADETLTIDLTDLSDQEKFEAYESAEKGTLFVDQGKYKVKK